MGVARRRQYSRANGCPKTLWFVSLGEEGRNLILSRDFARTVDERGQRNHVIGFLGIDQATYGDVLRLWCRPSWPTHDNSIDAGPIAVVPTANQMIRSPGMVP
jgi:hypothetical protein